MFSAKRIAFSHLHPEGEKQTRRILLILPAAPALWNAKHIPLG
jgi:hypothetical protein